MRAFLVVAFAAGGYCFGVWVVGWSDFVSGVLGVVLALVALEAHELSR